MTRAELRAWADHPAQRADPMAAAVRDLFRDFAALCDMGGVPGYETVKKDNEILTAHVAQLQAECHRLRQERLAPAPWE